MIKMIIKRVMIRIQTIEKKLLCDGGDYDDDQKYGREKNVVIIMNTNIYYSHNLYAKSKPVRMLSSSLPVMEFAGRSHF